MASSAGLEPHVTEVAIGLAKFVEVLIGGRQDKGPAHFLQQVGLDADLVQVMFDQNFVTAMELVFIQTAYALCSGATNML